MISNPYLAATSEAAMITTERRLWVEVSGPDARRFLNTILTANIRDLTPGAGSYSALCTAKGRMIGDLFAYALSATEFGLDIELNQHDEVLAAIRRYIVADKVTIADAVTPMEMIAIVGPQAEAVLSRHGFTPPTEEWGLHSATWQNHPYRLIRKKWWGFPWIELWFPSTARPEIIAHFRHLPLIDHTTQEVLRIESATPKYGVDMNETTIPQEANLYNAISFTKGCYVGQEIIARLEHRGHVARQLTLFRHHSADLPKIGSSVQTESGDEVGTITSACVSAQHRAPIALAYIKYTILRAAHPLAGYTILPTAN